MKQTRSEPVTLLSLPPEIQTKILSYLVSSFGKPTIQSVLRTCKQLYEVALPLSVRVFRNTAPYIEGGGPCSRARNVQFLRYILISKPQLSIHVKTVILGSFSSVDGPAEHWKDIAQPQETKSSQEELAVYKQTIKTILDQLHIAEPRNWLTEWVDDLKYGYSDAQIALILLVCMNVSTLLFEQSTQPRHFIRLVQMVGLLRNSCPPFNGISQFNIPLLQVQDVFHETNDIEAGYIMFHEQAPILFHLPRLRFYECNLVDGDDTAAEEFKSLAPRSCSVEEITIRCSSITGSTLQQMLKACKALKKLEYTHFSFTGAVMRIMPQEFMEALLIHSNTLEDLYIDMEEYTDKGWEWKDHPERLYMGSRLSQLHSLKKLTISMQCLTGILAGPPENNGYFNHPMPLRIEGAPTLVECLPESLEFLKITSCGEEIWEMATELLRTVEQGQQLTKLTYICFLFNEWLMKSEIELRCYSSRVYLGVGHHSQDQYLFDLGYPNDATEGRGVHNCTSRIYAPDSRKVYLALRGSTEHSPGTEGLEIDIDSFEE